MADNDEQDIEVTEHDDGRKDVVISPPPATATTDKAPDKAPEPEPEPEEGSE